MLSQRLNSTLDTPGMGVSGCMKVDFADAYACVAGRGVMESSCQVCTYSHAAAALCLRQLR